MDLLNAFTATVWATPLVVGFSLSRGLRRAMRPVARAATWAVYLAWAWGWVWIWHSINSGGSGRYAVGQVVFDWGVRGTTLLGAVALAWAESARRGDPGAK